MERSISGLHIHPFTHFRARFPLESRRGQQPHEDPIYLTNNSNLWWFCWPHTKTGPTPRRDPHQDGTHTKTGPSKVGDVVTPPGPFFICKFRWWQLAEGRSLNCASCQGDWSERSCPRSASAIPSVVVDQTPNLPIERRTLHPWAIAAQVLVKLWAAFPRMESVAWRT